MEPNNGIRLRDKTVIVDMDVLLDDPWLNLNLNPLRNQVIIDLHDTLLQTVYNKQPIYIQFATKHFDRIPLLRDGDPSDQMFNQRVQNIEDHITKSFDLSAVVFISDDIKDLIAGLVQKENPHLNDTTIRGIIDAASQKEYELFSTDFLLAINEEVNKLTL